MHSNNSILIVKTKNWEWETIIRIAFILVKIIDKKVAKTKASFLAFYKEIY